MSKFKLIDGFLFKDGQQVPFKASPNVGGKCKPKILVCHDTASGLNSDGPISWLCNKNAQASAHFVVGRAGDITQLVNTNRVAWHAGKSTYPGHNDGSGSVNSIAVGIEIVNPGIMTRIVDGRAFFDKSKTVSWDIEEFGIKKAAPLPLSLKRAEAYWMPYTDEQLEAVLGIGHAVKEGYNIGDVVAHWTVSPGRKVDTNPLFPLEEMKDAILKGTDMSKNTRTKTVVVKNNTSPADKEAVAKAAGNEAKAKNPNDTTIVKVTEPAAKANDPAETNVAPPAPIAGTPGDSKKASKVAPTDMNTIDPSVAPIMVPTDNTPVPPPQETAAERDINKSKAKEEDKEEQRQTLSVGLVTQELNLRQWPDSPNIIGTIAVGARIDIVRETSSQKTGSKWYKVAVTREAMNNYVGKEKVLEGFVHSAYIQRQ
jgi:N-acetyl-anhydromuramyl-L-alanine amidase AmpD